MYCARCHSTLITNGVLCEKCEKIAKLEAGFKELPARLKTMTQEREMNTKEKLNYLSGFIAAYRDQIHTDFRVKPGNNGPSIPTHRALLATRSVIFKNMLDSDDCKVSSDHTAVVSLPELSYDELDSLLEFLYAGELPKEKLDKHIYSLSVAADKYEIPFLQSYCQFEMVKSLNTSNAIDILEFSETYPNPHIKLKEAAMNFIVHHFEDIVFTTRFDAFAVKNPHLALQITKDSVTASKRRKFGF